MNHKIFQSLTENLQFSLSLQAYKYFFVYKVYKQVICQAKDMFWPEKKTVWSDKKN